MPFVKRNADGQILAVSEVVLDGFEDVSSTDTDLQNFLSTMNVSEELSQTDQAFIRVVEDVIELLIEKGVILFTELPDSAQRKMLERQKLRVGLRNALNILTENDSLDNL